MNGKWDLKTALSFIVAVFQAILLIFGWQVRDAVLSNEARIRELERFAAAGDRWTRADQMTHEKDQAEEMMDIWREIADLKVMVAKIHSRD